VPWKRPINVTIAILALAFLAACDEQGSFGNSVRNAAGDRVDAAERGLQGARDRLRSRRDGGSIRRGGRRGRSDLTAHRGDYVIEVSGYSNARFANAKGTLTRDMIDDCGDWTLQEKLDVTLIDQAKKHHRSNLLYRATEKTSADRFIFAYSRDHLSTREDYIGDARPVPGGFLASFMEPPITDLVLPEDVIYPINHFRRVLASARRQRGGFEAMVFDGGNAIAYLAVTEIGNSLRTDDDNPRVAAAREMLESKRSDRLPNGRTWPVTTSYFPLDDPNAPPIFTRDFLLHESGIIIGLHFDYGDFQMDASLANLDILEPKRCAPGNQR